MEQMLITGGETTTKALRCEQAEDVRDATAKVRTEVVNCCSKAGLGSALSRLSTLLSTVANCCSRLLPTAVVSSGALRTCLHLDHQACQHADGPQGGRGSQRQQDQRA